MKFLIIGLGSIGKRHMNNLLNMGHHCIGCESFEEFREKVPGVDATIICTPTHLHVDYAIESVRCGKHVFIEKPIAHETAGSISVLKTVVREKLEKYNQSIAIQVGYNLRYSPIIQDLKNKVSNNYFGKIHSVIVECGMYLPNWRPKPYSEYYSSHKEQGGGVTLDLSHEIDYVCYLFGLPATVAGSVSKSSDLQIDCEDVCDAIFGYESGMQVNIHLDYLQKERTRAIKIISEKGEFVFDLLLSPEEHSKTYIKEMEAFIKCIETDAVPVPDVIDGLVVVYLCKLIKNNKALLKTKFGKKGGFRW